MELSDEEFDQLISRAMDELPQEYIRGLDNVAVLMADWPDEYQKNKAKLGGHDLLLGLYEGIPLTQRGMNYNLVLPDKITLFKLPILRVVESQGGSDAELFEQIKRTLWHEIAHYYGLNHDQIDAIQRPGTE